MNVLISGGAKNGKSYYAQQLAKAMASEEGCPLYYVATMIPHDEEDEARILRHREERAGWGFATVERGRDLPGMFAGARSGSAEALPAADLSAHAQAGPESTDAHAQTSTAKADALAQTPDPSGVFLLDSVTALLSNEMFRADGTFDPEAAERTAAECCAFAEMTGNTVFVSDYIYGDAEEYDEITEAYRKGLALVDRRLAQICGRVIEVSAGCIEEWKSPIGDICE